MEDGSVKTTISLYDLLLIFLQQTRSMDSFQLVLLFCACSFSVLVLLDTRVNFFVCRIGLYLYKYRIYCTISIYILKGLPSVYQLI